MCLSVNVVEIKGDWLIITSQCSLGYRLSHGISGKYMLSTRLLPTCHPCGTLANRLKVTPFAKSRPLMRTSKSAASLKVTQCPLALHYAIHFAFGWGGDAWALRSTSASGGRSSGTSNARVIIEILNATYSLSEFRRISFVGSSKESFLNSRETFAMKLLCRRSLLPENCSSRYRSLRVSLLAKNGSGAGASRDRRPRISTFRLEMRDRCLRQSLLLRQVNEEKRQAGFRNISEPIAFFFYAPYKKNWKCLASF